MSDNQGNNGMLTGFLVGSIVGAGLALLMAPRSGNETRRILGQAATGLKDNAGSMVHDARQSIMDGVHDVKERMDEGKNRLARGAREMGNDIQGVSIAGNDGTRP